MKRIITQLFSYVLLISLLPHSSCDDRIPDDSATAESGSLVLVTRYIVGSTSNPVIVGEVLSNPQASAVVIARLLDGDGEGVNGKSLSFSVSGVTGSFDTNDPTTKYVPNFKEYGFPDLGGNGYAIARFTPDLNEKKIETTSSSGAIITVKYTDDIIDYVEFSVYDKQDLVWPYTINISADDQVDLGGSSDFEVLLENAYGDELSGVNLILDSEQGSLQCADTCFTDDAGKIQTVFEAYSFDDNVGPGAVKVKYYHPEIQDSVSVTQQIIIGSESVIGNCADLQIPSSVPSTIVVKNGGGVESTLIKAELYDQSNNLINESKLVRFKLYPVLEGCYLEEPGVTDTSVYSINGIASVSVNSGTRPGPIRVEVSTDCDLDGEIDVYASKTAVIIEAGPPHFIVADWSVNSTQSSGACFYQRQIGALVYDRYYNPVEDSIYVYWTLEPLDTNTVAEASVQGTSFTYNTPWENGSEPTHGMAFSTLVYDNDYQGKNCIITAYTWGDDINGDGVYGDSIGTIINLQDGYSQVSLFEPTVTVSVPITAYDFTLPFPTDSLIMTLTARVTTADCDEPVEGVPISFSGNNIVAWQEFSYENERVDLNGNGVIDEGEGWIDEGLEINGVLEGSGDGIFTWRDYGADDDPATSDEGNYNDDHDAIDITGDGEWDVPEKSEFFNDWGIDGLPNTFDEGEGNGEWDGFHMLGGLPIVNTDKNGTALITVIFVKEQCQWASYDDQNELCYWDQADATIIATCLIPTITQSDPVSIILTRAATPGPVCQ